MVSVEGGTGDWKKGSLPIVRGKRTVSIQRQVRMTAGSLVLAGLALGVLVNPGFRALSGLIGAGLVFSGASGAGAMGAVLAPMPWNRRSAPRAA